MENASEALIIAFGVLIFVIALTMAVNSFSQAKTVSDIVLYNADETNYYEYQGATGKASQNRIVGLETIIPTLYKYDKENYTVLFRQGTYTTDTGEFSNVRPLEIYVTPSRYQTAKGTFLWGKADINSSNQSTYDTLMHSKYDQYFDTDKYSNGSNKIFSFDVEEETSRHEPWQSSQYGPRENINCFLNGKIYYKLTDGQKYIDYDSFISKYSRKHFVETIGEYEYKSSQSLDSDTEDEVGSTLGDNSKDKKKRIVIFTLID